MDGLLRIQGERMTRFDVPCNGCTACCRKGGHVFLYPDKGDIVEVYQTEPGFNPVAGRMGHRLKQKADGSCIYLGEAGCTIFAHAPHSCRVFDCRSYWRSMAPMERKAGIKRGDEVLVAAKALIGAASNGA